MSPEKLAALQTLFPLLAILITLITTGWVITTWMRIKHGYPLENSCGKAIYPRRDDETVERVRLLSQENAQLRAELGSVKDRLANVERIVTDESHQLASDIEALRLAKN